MDAFEAAKIDENHEPVLEVKAREEAKERFLARMAATHRVSALSPYATIPAPELLEHCYRRGLTEAPTWTEQQQRIALTLLLEDEVAALTPPAPPTPEAFHAMPRAVPLPQPRAPRPKPVAPRHVDDLPASANGCYVVTKGGKCALPGFGLQVLREGKVLSRSYNRDCLQAMLDFGLEIVPQVPVDALPETEVMPTWDVEVGNAAAAAAFVRIQVALPDGIPPAEFAEWVQRSLAEAIAPVVNVEQEVDSSGESGAALDDADVLTQPSVLREIEAELDKEDARARAARAEDEAGDAAAAMAILVGAEAAEDQAAAEVETEDQAATRTRAAAETDPQTPRGKRGRKA